MWSQFIPVVLYIFKLVLTKIFEDWLLNFIMNQIYDRMFGRKEENCQCGSGGRVVRDGPDEDLEKGGPSGDDGQGGQGGLGGLGGSISV